MKSKGVYALLKFVTGCYVLFVGPLWLVALWLCGFAVAGYLEYAEHEKKGKEMA